MIMFLSNEGITDGAMACRLYLPILFDKTLIHLRFLTGNCKRMSLLLASVVIYYL